MNLVLGNLLYSLIFVLNFIFNNFFPSIRESILSAIYVLRPLWKCLQFQGNFNASATEKLPANCFIPSVTFLGSSVKPKTYATRNCYPVQSSETVNLLDQQLDKLIKSKLKSIKIILSIKQIST